MTHRPRALVLDDDENILSAFQDFFRREHCAMLSSSDPEEAFRTLAGTAVNLVIADLRVEREQGLALCRRIRVVRPHVPLIIITGYPNLVSEEDARSAGADFYFLKPLELDALRLAVRKCLRGAQHGGIA
jgi:DNA-binding response OmpR family regulator